ncbi:carboxy-S-adenosyl-L-methionine synthase CmoA [Parathalassolituus penaei]|uniref:Carboxy-S-adenosyl-L-methionine synthase n=1 Tax=Parathalassolituus penaei TaxID=2997323 RepID=A0A9X3EM53_9GAMM|nr:carboxy-S-adenosyl-L-methionine synthase CmoA [Parathalassolituus penaei]MCY0966901.1 carboxy-S-adenosyl-L-methionine synthase CmoA [Parathalassolituus penaei]
MSERDDIYQTLPGNVSDFRFDAAVARVFPDMIKRSVPGYAETVAMSGIIAGRYARDNTHLYDLGCSLGAVTLAMRHGVRAAGCKIIGIDNSESMVERASHHIALDDSSLAGTAVDVELACADILSYPLANASVTALNYVLQFISPEQRLALLKQIHDATIPGGVLILSEKLCFGDEEQQVQDALHLDFKRANGYSELEIARKRSAIENVLIPETEQAHIDRLYQAGFRQVVRWYQCFNFVSFLAIK